MANTISIVEVLNRRLLEMVKLFEEFISKCRTEIQPDPSNNINTFFKAVVGFPYDKELLLQAYLYLNIHQMFPECQELLLFEKPPLKGRTDLGKCDFVYLTAKCNLFLIETKYIDTEATGSTARSIRKDHRKKVFEQVIKLRDVFSQHYNLPINLFKCGVFTTDVTLQNDNFPGVVRSISIRELKHWQQTYNNTQ